LIFIVVVGACICIEPAFGTRPFSATWCALIPCVQVDLFWLEDVHYTLYVE